MNENQTVDLRKQLVPRPGRSSLWNGAPGLKVGVYAALLVALAIFALFTPGLLAPPSILSFLTSISFIGCVGVGMTLITISGNIMSFSLGATVAVSAIVYIAAANIGGFWFGVVASLLSGAFVSGGQGFLVGFLRANPIIVSIASSILIYGAAQPITGGASFYAKVGTPTWASAKVLGAPIEFVIFIAVVGVGQFLLSQTALGRRVYLVGSSFRAARALGAEAGRTIVGAYFWAGLFSAVAGLVLAMRYERAAMDFGTGYDYSAIAAVLVGGTAIAGGQGSVLRTCAGVMIIALVQMLLLLNGFRQEWQYLITGLIVLAVIIANSPSWR